MILVIINFSLLVKCCLLCFLYIVHYADICKTVRVKLNVLATKLPVVGRLHLKFRLGMSNVKRMLVSLLG